LQVIGTVFEEISYSFCISLLWTYNVGRQSPATENECSLSWLSGWCTFFADHSDVIPVCYSEYTWNVL